MIAEYRITRPDVYTAEDCPEKNDPSRRKGYFVKAETPHAAVKTFARDFPEDTCFDVQLWRTRVGIPPLNLVVRFSLHGGVFVGRLLNKEWETLPGQWKHIMEDTGFPTPRNNPLNG